MVSIAAFGSNTVRILTAGGLVAASWFGVVNTQGGKPTTGLPPLVQQAAGQLPLIWQDTFPGNSIDKTKWIDNTSAWPNGNCHSNTSQNQGEYNSFSNVSVSNGTLDIHAVKQTLNGLTWQSGTITTGSACYGNPPNGIASIKAGDYVEFQAKLPSVQGMWPALWLWDNNSGATNHGEIDLMEQYGDQPNRVYMTDHNTSGSAPQCVAAMDNSYTLTSNGASIPTGVLPLPGSPALSQGFHDYGVYLGSTGIEWFVDGNMVCQDSTGYNSTGAASIIINMAVNANGVNAPAPLSTTTSADFLVRSVKVFGNN